MTVVTTRRNVDLTICTYQCPRTKLGSALILIVLLFFILTWACWKRTGVSRLYYHQNFAWSKVWKHITLGEQYWCFRVVEDETWYLVFLSWFQHSWIYSIESLGVWLYEVKYGCFRGILGVIYWTTNRSFLSGLTRTNLTALLVAHTLISDFRYDHCGSIPLATAWDVNIHVCGAEAVLFWNLHKILEAYTLCWIAKVRICDLDERYHDVHTG